MKITASGKTCARHEMIAQAGKPRMHRVARRRSAARLGLAGLLALGIGAATNQAAAKSQFTVDNRSASRVRISVFDGDDSVCEIEKKEVSVSSGGNRSIQCPGGGKSRCKIIVEAYNTETKGQTVYICKNINRKACGTKAIRIIKDDQTLTVTGRSGDFSCEVSGGS
jgi:hypothetical protein